MDVTLANIRAKLAGGEKLSANDLRSLESLHDAIYGRDGRVVEWSGGTTQRKLDGPNGDLHLEYLDRSFLDGRDHQQHGKSSERLPRLVRYVGMVQDVLEPEYYESCDSRGRSKHFGDHFDWNGDDATGKADDCLVEETTNGVDAFRGADRYSDCLAERIPLVVVPIPFASDWLVRGIHARGNSDAVDGASGEGMPTSPKPAVVSPLSSTRGERKRERNDVDADGDNNMNGENNPSSFENSDPNLNQPTRQKTTECKCCQTNDGDGSYNGREDNLTSNSTNATDWWPAGTCGTSMDECPILAKMCYEELLSGGNDGRRFEGGMEEEHVEDEIEDSGTAQKGDRTGNHQRQRPLMLNEVVSFVGVLSMNPWDADFSGQQSSSVSSAAMNNDFYGWDSMMAAETNATPPPSRLPRLHVLSYKRFDLDGLARRAIHVETKTKWKSRSRNENASSPEREGVCGVNRGSESESDDDSDVEWSGFPSEEKSVASGLASLLQGGPLERLTSPEEAPWIQALWWCLLSEADRRPTTTGIDGTIVRAGPGERALGCVSLQLSTPDVASAKSLYRKLADATLPGICPVVAAVDLTERTTTGTSDVSFIPQKDNSGRLQPCPLQLPKGSVLLIHCPPPCTSMGNSENQNGHTKSGSENKDRNQLESVQTVIRELAQHHRIPYKFEGGVMIPFEADYRVIIVTTQTQDLPCTLTALTKTSSTTATPVAMSPKTLRCPTKPELREILLRGRSLNSSNDSFRFSSILLEQAQKAFLDRRRRCHESSSALPGEDDFHRWLTLTKLQAKNRFSIDDSSKNKSNTAFVEEEMGQAPDFPMPTQCFEPSISDWEVSLQLDDDLRRMV